MDSYVLAVAQLTQIKNRFNLHKKLSLNPKKLDYIGDFSVPKCQFLLHLWMYMLYSDSLIYTLRPNMCSTLSPYLESSNSTRSYDQNCRLFVYPLWEATKEHSKTPQDGQHHCMG